MRKKNVPAEMPIDIVVLWVDDTDMEWRKEKAKYQGTADIIGTDESRFRSWDNFHFFFRGVEEFAPWVNHIYLVTNGQKPSWLNLKHPKLTLINHCEIMPDDALPTFSSRAIDVSINKIPGLSEHFIFFNDDMFITAACKPTDFFINGLPVDNPVLGTNIPVRGNKGFGVTLATCYSLGVLNGHFRKKDVMNISHLYKWYGPHIGLRGLISALTKIHHDFFDGFKNHHCCQPFLKSVYDEIWELEPELLKLTVHYKFRNNESVNHWLMRYWQLAENKFAPQSLNNRYFANVCDWNIDEVINNIISKKYVTMCLNDSEISPIKDFILMKNRVIQALQQILPNKSSFEI